MRSKILIVAGLAASMLLVTATSASARRGHHVVVSTPDWGVRHHRGDAIVSHRQARRWQRKKARRMMRKANWAKSQTVARVNAKCARVASRLHFQQAKQKCRRSIRRAIANHNASWGNWAPLNRWDFAGLRAPTYRGSYRGTYRAAPVAAPVYQPPVYQAPVYTQPTVVAPVQTAPSTSCETY